MSRRLCRCSRASSPGSRWSVGSVDAPHRLFPRDKAVCAFMTLDFTPAAGPVSSDPVILDGSPIDFVILTRIARKTTHVAADGEALDRVRAARAVLMEAIASGQPVYGATTGVGAMKDVSWSSEELEAFNMGL